MLVVHLWDKGPRWPLMFTEGLLAMSGVDLVSNKDTVLWGQTVHRAEPEPELREAMREADWIYLQTLPGYYNEGERRFLAEEGLWDKVVGFDAHDFAVVDSEALGKARAYFKRLPGERDVGPIPLDYCSLDSYFPGGLDLTERDLDVVYLFDQNVSHRRLVVLRMLENAGFDPSRSIIGRRTDNRITARHGRFDIVHSEGPDNDFRNYLNLLARARIVFTCFPHHRNGDIRIWEAMASGAYVFSDIVTNPVQHPLVSGRHFFEYDAGNIKSIREAIQRAKHLLDPEGEAERREIADAGQQHVWGYHRALDRMTFVRDEVERKNLRP